MAEHETHNPDHPKTVVKLEEGETVALCRCFASKNFPICDGSHRDHPGKGPAVVSAPAKKKEESAPDP